MAFAFASLALALALLAALAHASLNCKDMMSVECHILYTKLR